MTGLLGECLPGSGWSFVPWHVIWGINKAEEVRHVFVERI
jgi:hypothetical protein